MASLANQTISSTYDGLIKTSTDQPVGVSGVQLLEDGVGNTLALSVGRANQGVTVTGTLTATAFSGPLTGNVIGNLTGDVTGDVTGNLTGNVTGDVTGDLTGTVITAAQPNITSVGTLSSLTVGGALNATISTAAQPNITSVGTLSSLAVSGNLTVDTNTIYVDATSNSVGIGTSSPASTLTVQGDLGGLFADASNTRFIEIVPPQASNSFVGEIGTRSSHSLAFNTVGSEKMRIDSSGNVGIGTSNPSANGLTIANGVGTVGGNSELYISANTSGKSVLALGDGANVLVNHILADQTTNHISFHTAAASLGVSERMRIDASGNVGIGTSSPSAKTHITSGSFNHLLLERTGAAAAGVNLKMINSDGEIVEINNTGEGAIQFNTGGSERMRIDASGNVGIGTASPAETLDISKSGTNAVVIRTVSTGDPSLKLTANGVNTGTITYNRATQALNFLIGGTEMIGIRQAGGLTFNGDTAAANALDDYEEGTFTPEFRDESGALTATYDVQTGTYTKIGNVVTFTISLGTDSVTIPTPSDQLRINLPFTARSGHSQGFSLGYNYNFATALEPYPTAVSGSDRLIFYSVNSVNVSLASSLNTGTNSNRLTITGTYLT